jgi:hypothetical protein
MLKMTAVAVMSVDTQTLGQLHTKRHSDGVVAMSEAEHQDMLELEREQAELGHAKWAAMRVRDYLASVVEGGGKGNGNMFRRTAVVRGKPTLDAAVELAADRNWVDTQLNTLRVKPRHMGVAKAHLATLVVKLIEREVEAGF